MPTEEDKWLKFTDISKQLKVPFVVYADFESILERHYGCQPDPNKSSTIKLAKHVPPVLRIKLLESHQKQQRITLHTVARMPLKSL